MRTIVVVILVTAILSGDALTQLAAQVVAPGTRADEQATLTAQQHAQARMQDDVAALQTYRPEFPFWRHIFTIADGAIVYGSAVDGRLLATFPADGDWRRDGVVGRPGAREPARRPHRCPTICRIAATRWRGCCEPAVGRVVHNATRGLFLLPNERRYGAFLDEWGAIYERFGVPAELGLAQAIVESGLDGTARSEARAIGFCQWLLGNWNRLKRLSPHVIEGYNQTTQAPYCAAYLSILATKYGSFIPALSEHHAGGTNVGRTLINGERLGGVTTRDRYFLGIGFRARPADHVAGDLSRRLRLVRSAVDPLRRDGVRKHRQRRAHPHRGAAAEDLRDAAAARADADRDRAPCPAVD